MNARRFIVPGGLAAALAGAAWLAHSRSGSPAGPAPTSPSAQFAPDGEVRPPVRDPASIPTDGDDAPRLVAVGGPQALRARSSSDRPEVEEALPAPRTWVVRIGDGVEVLPCAELDVHRGDSDVVLRADSSGRLEAALVDADRLSLRMPGPGDLKLPVRVVGEAPHGPSLLVDLRSVVVLATPSAGEWSLIPTGARIDPHSGRLASELRGWPCGVDRSVFPFPGSVPGVDAIERGRATFIVREGEQRVGSLDVPWPCWASDGAHPIVRGALATASLRVRLLATGTSDRGGAVQLTLKAAGAARSSPPLAVEFAQIGEPAEFLDLEPQAVRLYVSGERVLLGQHDFALAPGSNEFDIWVDLAPAPLAFEVRVTSRSGELEPGLHVTALPALPGARPADLPLDVRQDVEGRDRGRARLALAPGEWRLRVYSPRTGIRYVADHPVRAEDGGVDLVLDAPVRRVPILLSEDAPASGLDFWLDATGEGLRLTGTEARPGAILAQIPASASAAFWILTDERGLLAHGGLDELRLEMAPGGEQVYVLVPGAPRPTVQVVRLATRERGGLVGILEDRRSNPLGYVLLAAPLPPEVRIEGTAKPRTVIAREAHPWGTTLWLAD